MIDVILKNETFRRVFPPIAGVIFVAAFVSLGLWQLDRASQKTALLAKFSADAPYLALDERLPDRAFQPIATRGRFLGSRQVLIENIVRDGRVGFFVITPFEQSGDQPLLLVNRGWLARTGQQDQQAQLKVDGEVRNLRGRAGHLPRVSVRPGSAFDGAGDWPKSATYPTLDDVAAELGNELLPLVLLLDPDDRDGFRRQWQPEQGGPMINYGYAFQWFAMAIAVLVILVWQLRKGVRGHESGEH